MDIRDIVPYNPALSRKYDAHINVDIVEKEKEYEIYADLPGFEKSDIKVSANNHILTIEGQMTHDESQKLIVNVRV